MSLVEAEAEGKASTAKSAPEAGKRKGQEKDDIPDGATPKATSFPDVYLVPDWA